MDHLCNWLEEHKDAEQLKFIVSPTVFVPNSTETAGSDEIHELNNGKTNSWPAFPAIRRGLIQHIVDDQVQYVFFLSGDRHCSNVARFTFSGTPEVEFLKPYSVASSAFYWPFLFADDEPANYVHNSKQQNDTFVMDEKKATPKGIIQGYSTATLYLRYLVQLTLQTISSALQL